MSYDREVFDVAAEAARALNGFAGPVTAETNILRDLGFDSLTVMDFIMALETRFDTIIPLDRLANIETLGDLVDLLAEQQSTKVS